MRWLSYDGLTLGLIAAIVIVFTVVDYIWYKRQLARLAKLASDEHEPLRVGPRAPSAQLDPESQPAGQLDDPR